MAERQRVDVERTPEVEQPTRKCCWKPWGVNGWEHKDDCACECHKRDWVAVRKDELEAARRVVEAARLMMHTNSEDARVDLQAALAALDGSASDRTGGGG